MLFDRHSILLCDTPGSVVVGMDQGDHPIQLQIAESMIPHRASGLSRKPTVPKFWVEAVADLDLILAVHFLVEKTAVANEGTRCTLDHRELRGQTGPIPTDDFVEESRGLR